MPGKRVGSEGVGEEVIFLAVDNRYCSCLTHGGRLFVGGLRYFRHRFVFQCIRVILAWPECLLDSLPVVIAVLQIIIVKA